MARPRRDSDDDILIATESGYVEVDGQSCIVSKGVTRARRGSAIVALTPGWWKRIDVHYDVERATAAPGEKRGE